MHKNGQKLFLAEWNTFLEQYMDAFVYSGGAFANVSHSVFYSDLSS